MHAPAFVVLGTWALVLMFRDHSRELGLVGLSGLRLVRLPFGMMAVHVRRKPPRASGPFAISPPYVYAVYSTKPIK